MKTVIYTSLNKDAVADYKAEKIAREFLLNLNQASISVSTENFITALRCLIMDGVYPPNQVTILYEGHRLSIDKDGRLPDWPKGFCDYTESFYLRLLHGRGK